MENIREAILTTIEKNSRIDMGELAIRLGIEEVEVANTLEELEKEGIQIPFRQLDVHSR